MLLKAKKEGKAIQLGLRCFACCTWTVETFPVPGVLGFLLRRLQDGDTGEVETFGAFICNDCATRGLPGYVPPENAETLSEIASQSFDRLQPESINDEPEAPDAEQFGEEFL